MTGRITVAVFSLALCFCAMCVAQEATPVDDPNAGLAYSVPEPITTIEFERFSQFLSLSEAQQLFVDGEFQKYQTEWARLVSTKVSVLLKVSTQARVALAGGYTPVAAQLHQEFCELEVQIRNEIGELEDKLFLAISTILHESQLPKLERVKQTRSRSRCFPFYVLVNGAQVDLTALLRKFHPKAAQEDETVDELLADYETKATPLFVQLRKALDSHASVQVWALSRYQFEQDGKPRDPNTPEAQRLAESYFAQNKSALGNSSRLQKQILEVNQRSFAAVVEHMNLSSRDPFVSEFLRLTYPDVFPDPTDPRAVYESILKNEQFERDVLENLEALWNAYRDSYIVKCRHMQEENTRWRVQLAATEIQNEYSDYLEKMRKLRHERIKLNMSILNQIMQAFPNELTSDSKSLIENHLGLATVFSERNQPATE
jgi:hypothetical protein